jgi:hypothetical protein
MFDLKNLENARQKSSVNTSSQEKFNQLYCEGVGLLKNFSESRNPDISILKLSAEKLLEAVKIVRSKPEAYLFLAYVFYILGDSGLSQRYLKVCNMIDPTITGFDKLKRLLAAAPPVPQAKRLN